MYVYESTTIGFILIVLLYVLLDLLAILSILSIYPFFDITVFFILFMDLDFG